MVRCSNLVVGLVNLVLMVLGLSAVGVGAYMHFHGTSDCLDALQIPLLTTGGFLVALALLGLVGACGKNNRVMLLYLGVLFALILGLIAFSVFVFLVTYQRAGKAVSDVGIGKYKTWDFSNWLGKHFVEGKRWAEIRTCLAEANVCKGSNGAAVSEFLQKSLSPVEAGCCRPPQDCGSELRNAALWVPPRNGTAAVDTAADDPDCGPWNAAANQLCFACNACKAGVLASIRQQWRHLLIFNVCLVILTLALYAFSCCARRNNSRDKVLYVKSTPYAV